MQKPNSVPNPDIVIASLDSFLCAVIPGLEDGTSHAREYFEKREIDLEPPLVAMMVRSKLREHLVEWAARTDIPDFSMNDVPLIGLDVNVLGCQMKIWKANRTGGIPYPGSEKRRLYLDQRQLELIPVQPNEIRYVLLWTVVGKYNFDWLQLACPKRPSNGQYNPAETYWVRTIDHPATGIQQQPSIAPTEPLVPDYQLAEDDNQEQEKQASG